MKVILSLAKPLDILGSLPTEKRNLDVPGFRRMSALFICSILIFDIHLLGYSSGQTSEDCTSY